MFLSIIIPVYKVEPYLRECLDSIAASSMDCWEAILIDDGSPDGCPQICDEYAAHDKRFRVIHQKNAGVAAARNAGLDVARGEWIWFVDSDDVVNMQHVEGLMEWLKANENGTAELYKNEDKKVDGPVNIPVDLVMFNLNKFKDNESENKDVRVNVSVGGDVVAPVDKNNFLLENVTFHHQRLWYRRELLNQYELRFTKGVRLAEDLEFMYKYMTLCLHPVKIDTTLYYYRVREGSATQNSTYRGKAVEDLQLVLGNLSGWIQKFDIKPEPWLDLRIKMLFQNLLYSASQVKALDVATLQTTVRTISEEYNQLHFSFVNKIKNRLAKKNVKLFFFLNRVYLKVKEL